MGLVVERETDISNVRPEDAGPGFVTFEKFRGEGADGFDFGLGAERFDFDGAAGLDDALIR